MVLINIVTSFILFISMKLVFYSYISKNILKLTNSNIVAIIINIIGCNVCFLIRYTLIILRRWSYENFCT